MLQRLLDYDSPQMQEFATIPSDTSGNVLRMVSLVTLTNIASLLVMGGEIVDPYVGLVAILNPQPAYFNVNLEMRLTISDKHSTQQRMRDLRSEDCNHIWKLIQLELEFRRASINPIRKLNLDTNVAPFVRWNLSQAEFVDDLQYSNNAVYETNVHEVLEQRWEWGRKFWTLHAKHVNESEQDSRVIVAKGRSMEIEARNFLRRLNLLF